MPKTKLSVTVETSVVKALNRASRKSNRSEIVELALVRWLRDQTRKEIDEDTERYYKEMTPEEREDDREWAEMSYQAIGKTWR
jgi:hypothetical protein